MHLHNRLTHRHTLLACYGGYLTQALVINFPPLLFLTFQRELGLTLSQVSSLIAITFVTQLSMDALASVFMKRVSYRAAAIAAHVFAVVGMIGMGVLPDVLPTPYVGLCIATVLAGVGGGLTEVIISPMVEACPTEDQSGGMSLLHSFYCWGTVLVILLSTLFLLLAGKGLWWLLPLLWSLLPLFNTLALAVVPLPPMEAAAASPAVPSRPLWRRPLFWVFLGVMMAAGASELSMHQWASAFAEAGLGVPKAVGDLAGPCLYAALMGTARVFFARMSDRIDLRLFLLLGGTLGTLGYLLAALSPLPVLSLAGCGITGLSVGMLWPGALSLAAARLRDGSTLLFSLCALFGDLGCSLGPTAVGLIAAALGGDLSRGLLCSAVFPVLFVVLLLAVGKEKPKDAPEKTVKM